MQSGWGRLGDTAHTQHAQGFALTHGTTGNNGKGGCMPPTAKQPILCGARKRTRWFSLADLAEDMNSVPSTHRAAGNRVHSHPTS